jgi:microcystin degradation protein MlrC
MRIAMGGIAHETNTFSTLPTTLGDFTIMRGDELLEGTISRDFWQRVVDDGNVAIPVMRAYATPSGKVTVHAFETLLGELIEGIKAAMPLDGVLLYLHGAMEVEKIGDGETAILEAVREVIGPEPLVAATLDLHANLAPAVAEMADIITAYRTAPHRDSEVTRVRGAELLLHCLESEVRPTVSLVKLPLLVAGEAAVTEVSPSRELFAGLSARSEEDGILDASILIGCAWTDSLFTTVSTIACGTDRVQTDAVAREIAQKVWDRRADFAIDSVCADPQDVVDLVFSYPERTVFVSDSGDNPTAGAAGDSPLLLSTLLRRFEALPPGSDSSEILLAGIADAGAVAACGDAGVGATLDVRLGGKLDAVTCAPLAVEATVRGLFPEDGKFGDAALVRIGGIDVVIQAQRAPFTSMDDFLRLGLRPEDYRLIVVKLGYLFPELRDSAPRHIMALTPGFGDQRTERLEYSHLKRPIYPLDPETQL